MDKVIEYKFKTEKAKLVSINNILQAHNPLNILNKGYAIIEDEENNLIKGIDDFKDGNEVKIVLQDGYVKGKLSNIEKRGITGGKERKL